MDADSRPGAFTIVVMAVLGTLGAMDGGFVALLVWAALGYPVGEVLSAGGAKLWRLKLPDEVTEQLALDVAPMLDEGRASGAQAAGHHAGQAVRFWTESVASGTQLNCSVRAPRGAAYLETVAAEDLGLQAFTGPGERVIRRGGLRAAWTAGREPAGDTTQAWVGSILAAADGRLVADDQRVPRLVELAEAGKPSAFEALVAEAPDHPRLAELAEHLRRWPEPAVRVVGARWLGADALEALIDELAYEPRWQAHALRVRAELAELSPDAVRRWVGIPGLRLELLIDQMRRGSTADLDGLADSAPTWNGDDEVRLEALADAIIERGAEVEAVARRLFEAQPAGRVHLARALGEIGGMPSLATLRAARDAVDWPRFDADEVAADAAMARIIHRLGDAAAGMLALDEPAAPDGALAVVEADEPV